MKSIESDITGDSIEDDNESLNIVSKWAAHKNAIFDVAWRSDDRWIVIIWNFSILIFYSVLPQPILLAKCGMLNEKQSLVSSKDIVHLSNLSRLII